MGKIEKFILDELRRMAGEGSSLVPVSVLATRYAERHGVERSATLYSTFRRAARHLEDRKLVAAFVPVLPTRWDSATGEVLAAYNRKMVALAIPGTRLTPVDTPAAAGLVKAHGVTPVR